MGFTSGGLLVISGAAARWPVGFQSSQCWLLRFNFRD